MRLFYDTEFHEDGHTIDFISIGMVRDDNAVYYAVSAEADYVRAAANPWLNYNVLRYLPMLTETQIDVDNVTVKSRALIRDEVRQFVLGVDDPQLWAWYGAYDHVVLAQLFGRMIDLPAGFPMWTNDLRQEVNRLGNPKLPEQVLHAHHALADAQQVQAWAGYLERTRRVQDEIQSGAVAEGRKAAADAVWARAKSLRAKDFPAGKVGIEYVNGFEDAAHVADPNCKP